LRAILLAAGRGSRLGALTSDRPKALVEFNGRSLLSRTVAHLRTAGIKEIGIVAGYRRNMLDAFADRLFVNEAWGTSGIFASLSTAAEWLADAPCIVSYCDIFYPVELVASMMVAKADIAVAYDPNAVDLWKRRFDDPLEDLESFTIGSDSQITSIGGRASHLSEIQGQYMGLMRLTPAGWRAIRRASESESLETRHNVDMTTLLSRSIEQGTRLYGIPLRGPWGEIDSPTDITLYETLYPGI
jgi:L-glutamine-phosphate cytidylyltransferase